MGIDIDEAIDIISDIPGLDPDDNTNASEALTVVCDTLDSQSATIARLEAELERARGERDKAEGVCKKAVPEIRCLYYQLTGTHLEEGVTGHRVRSVVDELTALSARQNNDAANATGGE